MQKIIIKEFRFLLDDYGFEFVGEKFEGLVVIFKNEQLNIEFTKDRSDFFVNIKSSKSKKEYEDIYTILTKMRQLGIINENYSPNNKMSLAKKVLRKHFIKIRDYLVKNVDKP